eukprot:1140066-Pelagomonas_calceolata.AAC.5
MCAISRDDHCWTPFRLYTHEHQTLTCLPTGLQPDERTFKTYAPSTKQPPVTCLPVIIGEHLATVTK